MGMTIRKFAYSLLLITLISTVSWAQGPEKTSDDMPESVDVSKLKKKYWAKGEDAELEVIMSRQFTKSGKFRLEASYGFLTTDPFLSVTSMGGALAFYIGENWGIQAFGFKHTANSSSAYDTAISLGFQPLVNKPSSQVGAEALVSPLYGKLSVFGKSIVYFDIYGLIGASSTSTGTGSYLSPHLGIGQQVYIAKRFAIDLSSRMTRFTEKLTNGSSRSITNAVTQIGIAFFVL